MLRPSEEVLLRTRGTLLDFLKREELKAMKIAFKTSTELLDCWVMASLMRSALSMV